MILLVVMLLQVESSLTAFAIPFPIDPMLKGFFAWSDSVGQDPHISLQHTLERGALHSIAQKNRLPHL
jgi:hypothetical protein